MTIAVETDPTPLKSDEHGAVRVAGTRVTLDSIVYGYLQGEPPEYIQEAFPTVSIADVYATISYYLRHREAVDRYLDARRSAADELRRRIESTPEYQRFRETLLERAGARGLR